MEKDILCTYACMQLTTSDGRFATAIFPLQVVYVWLFTCVRLQFASPNDRFMTAIFLLWEQKNRMTSEFRCMFTTY